VQQYRDVLDQPVGPRPTVPKYRAVHRRYQIARLLEFSTGRQHPGPARSAPQDRFGDKPPNIPEAHQQFRRRITFSNRLP
jgi:hypothetical protein